MHLILLDGLSEAFALLETVMAGARRRGLVLYSLHCEQRGCLARLRMQVGGGEAGAAERFVRWLGTLPSVTGVARATVPAAPA